MEFIRIESFVIRVSNIAGFMVSDAPDNEPQVVLYLIAPHEGRSAITIDGGAAERVLEWIGQKLGYLDLRPGHESKGVVLG
ncbi:MAG TPA: hypothetical protein VGE07_19495 [Herpetosiphonaceae bacterium]